MENVEKNIHEKIKGIVNTINELSQRGKDIRFDRYDIEKIRKTYILDLNGVSNYNKVYEDAMNRMMSRPEDAAVAFKVDFDDRNKTFEKYNMDVVPLDKQIMDMDTIEAETYAQIFEQVILLNSYTNENDLTEEEKNIIKSMKEKYIGDFEDLSKEELSMVKEHLQMKKQNVESQIMVLRGEVDDCQQQIDNNTNECQNVINNGIAEGMNIQEYSEKHLGKIRNDYQNLSKQIFDNGILLELSSEINDLNLEQYKVNYLLNQKENYKQEDKINDNDITVSVILQDVLGNPTYENTMDFKQNIGEAISDVKESDIEQLKQRMKDDNVQEKTENGQEVQIDKVD